jgi:hypothetical protein
MHDDVGGQIHRAGTGSDKPQDLHASELSDNELESDAAAVAAERTGRANTAHEMTASPGQEPPPGRWDSIGEPGEGLDELQGLYTNDTSTRDHLPEQGGESTTATGSPLAAANAITPELWDQLKALEGQTVETPKGEPFRVIAVKSGACVTVSPLDGGQRWDVPAQELEAGWPVLNRGTRLDGLASIRLQEAGVGSVHPEYVAGLLRAITGSKT